MDEVSQVKNRLRYEQNREAYKLRAKLRRERVKLDPVEVEKQRARVRVNNLKRVRRVAPLTLEAEMEEARRKWRARY